MASLEDEVRPAEPEEAFRVQVTENDFTILSYEVSPEAVAWLEAAARQGAAVQHGTAAVPSSLAQKPPIGAKVDRGWVALRAVPYKEQEEVARDLVVVATLGHCLAQEGVPWRMGPEVLLVRRRDLPAAAKALVRAGHVVWPASAVLPPAVQGEDPPGFGAWRLERREEPVGIIRQMYKASEGPLRLQSRCGFYAEVRPGDDLTSQASSCGRCRAVTHLGKSVIVSQSFVDFRPFLGAWPRHCFHVSEDTMEVVGDLPRFGERWKSLGEGQAVVLELVDEKRAGLWLFCGHRFARVVGGRVGSCCSSLARLSRLDGKLEELQRYEAMEGEVEAPGELRVTRNAWCESGFRLFSSNERSSAQLKRTEGKVSRLLLRLPTGIGEEWKVHRWEFDPFDAEDPEGQRPQQRSRSKSPMQSRKAAKRAVPKVPKVPKVTAAAKAAAEAKASKFASAFAAAAAAVAAATAAHNAIHPNWCNEPCFSLRPASGDGSEVQADAAPVAGATPEADAATQASVLRQILSGQAQDGPTPVPPAPAQALPAPAPAPSVPSPGAASAHAVPPWKTPPPVKREPGA
ncbi:unnamed protein product [Effrenium voratum]|nr:unnamed protein product [Effrenium voratum]